MACQNPIQTKYGSVPCAKCRDCKIQAVKDWNFRLTEELNNSVTAYFITLTYAENPEKLNIFDLRAFLKLLRQTNYRTIENHCRRKDPAGKRIKMTFFAVGEYGDKFGRPHWHILLFNFQTEPKRIEFLIQKNWKHGLIHVGKVNDTSINYVVKYLFKHRELRTSSISKNIGESYIEKFKDYHNATGERTINYKGKKRWLPKYYFSKIYSETSQKIISERLKQNSSEKHIEKYSDINPDTNINIIASELEFNRQQNITFNNQKR